MKNVLKTNVWTAILVIGGALQGSADPVEAFLDEQSAELEAAVPGKFNINLRQNIQTFDAVQLVSPESKTLMRKDSTSVPPTGSTGTLWRWRPGVRT